MVLRPIVWLKRLSGARVGVPSSGRFIKKSVLPMSFTAQPPKYHIIARNGLSVDAAEIALHGNF
jgi:hypothetical protein